ncbi:NACHT domain-containing protein [Nocardia sp. NPDC127579]|uniref:NACHT domain-containing protein n=1 Tax=Nocardia sp. NPDC127579 TaxID=3345402 RepID=UPI00363ED460
MSDDWSANRPQRAAMELAVELRRAVADIERAALRALLRDDFERLMDTPLELLERPDAAPRREPVALEEIAALLQQRDGNRVVVTGPGGSGKTVLALRLVLHLLDRPLREAPVPVVLPVADLRVPAGSKCTAELVSRWLVDRIHQRYGLSRRAAGTLVRARLVLPVLDGLDEAEDSAAHGSPESRSARVLRACDAFLERTVECRTAVVVTCRDEEYAAASTAWPLRRYARVRVCPLTASSAADYLTAATLDRHRWSAVIAASRSADTAVAQSLSAPWRLATARIGYDQRATRDGRDEYLRDPADLLAIDRVEEHLVDLHLQLALERRGGVSYTAADLRSAMSTLAAHAARSETALVPHELWRLPGARAVRALTLVLTTVCGLPVAAGAWWYLGFGERPGIGWVAAVSAGLAVAVGLAGWGYGAAPQPQAAGLIRSLRSPRGRRRLIGWWLVLIGAVLLFGQIGSHRPWAVPTLAVLVATVLVVQALRLADTTSDDVAEHRSGILATADLLVWPAHLFLAGLAVLHVASLLATPGGSAAGIFFAFVWLFFGVATSAVGYAANLGWNQIGLVLLTRRGSGVWLPVRHNAFLRWAREAALLRAAGGGYRFRYPETSEYLVRSPALVLYGWRGLAVAVATDPALGPPVRLLATRTIRKAAWRIPFLPGLWWMFGLGLSAASAGDVFAATALLAGSGYGTCSSIARLTVAGRVLAQLPPGVARHLLRQVRSDRFLWFCGVWSIALVAVFGAALVTGVAGLGTVGIVGTIALVVIATMALTDEDGSGVTVIATHAEPWQPPLPPPRRSRRRLDTTYLEPAEEVYRYASDLGSATAVFHLGRLRAAQGDTEAALRCFQAAAEAGVHAAAHEAERLLRRAEPGEHSVPFARTVALDPTTEIGPDDENRHRLAADAGDTAAMLTVGTLLHARGDAAAAEWFTRAAASGRAEAMFALGCVLEGQDDLDQAEQWYRRAAEANSGAAVHNLARLLELRGDGDSARRWYEQVTDDGVWIARANLALLAERRGDTDVAGRHFRDAAAALTIYSGRRSRGIPLASDAHLRVER